jgi:hypothetical protein
MIDEIKDQLTAFLTGFYDVIPPKILKNIDEKELGIYLSGQANFDGRKITKISLFYLYKILHS